VIRNHKVLLFGSLIVLSNFSLAESSRAMDWRTPGCVQEAAQNSSPSQVAIQAKDIVQQISSSIGLLSNDITVLPCDEAEKVYSDVSDGTKVKAGRYIMFDQEWLREVVGQDPVQLTAVFGHELGHFLDDDFGSNAGLDSKIKEARADHFAGCAVAKQHLAWDPLESLLARIRDDPNKSQLYPDRLTSIETARQGFLMCGGKFNKQCRIASNGVERWSIDAYPTKLSPWRGGGGNQPGWCSEAMSIVVKEFPSPNNVQVIGSSETKRSTCSPFNCTQYQYSCIFHVLSNPIYKLATSDSCP
jgi:hypothetical protein